MIKSGIGTQDEISRLYKCFKPPHPPTPTPTVVYSTDRSKAVVPLLVLLFLLCGLFYEVICLSLALCYFILVFFSPFSIAITSLWEETANLSAFRTFVQFALVWFCLFSLPLGI